MTDRATCVCGWESNPVDERTGQFLAVAHVAVRHPDVYRRVTGKDTDQFSAELDSRQRVALGIAVEAGML